MNNKLKLNKDLIKSIVFPQDATFGYLYLHNNKVKVFNETAGKILKFLSQHDSLVLEDIVSEMQKYYDISSDQLRESIKEFIINLIKH